MKEEEMASKNKRVLYGLLATVAIITIMVAVFFIGRGCKGEEKVTTVTGTTTHTVTVVPEPETETQLEPSPTVQPAPEPTCPTYTTMADAIAYVKKAVEPGSTLDATILDAASTWQEANALHVIHATPTGSASWGGDYYYFFVDGCLVGEQSFARAVSQQTIDGETFDVTFEKYLPTDPHCCPTGGNVSIQFYWNGASLLTIGSVEGANM